MGDNDQTPVFTKDMTLGAAQDQLREMVWSGAICPCCTQRAQVYRRKVNSAMARSLIAMYRLRGTGWIHLPTEIGARSREEGKLRYWGLVAEEATTREDGGHAGVWRVTETGEAWIVHQSTIQKYVWVYNGRPLRFDGGTVTIHDALGDKFDLQELLHGV